ncbi:hypothetical protein C8034_v001628 [Colletotrichum sidae]|uniref:EKC/KEOPS complex subunit GON7 n=3 Tax=Colletotrichum orbiculare species complex TaxID=2707354 RepID=N4V929_COLOR|nr:hypothetical protein Cob_v001848 [Colletotrichum orbiculare MAFF 240422]TDZ46056.1 hypothetical protein CTRI78_v009083 [Colletotrichum trifolii]TEA16592.1 hypothetical protein C8034_v001628 [Colletotrichum sidae]
MASSNGTSAPAFQFSATYSSPTNEPFTFAESLRAPPSSGVAEKSAYLNSLRKAINSAQENINKQLTARMEEDKAREAIQTGVSKAAVDEALEEENYGEEAPPNDD